MFKLDTKIIPVKFLLVVSIILIFVFVFYFYLIFTWLSDDRLYGDEVFYWFQSRAISEQGKFVNFQNTQPLLFPLVLSLFDSVNFGRVFNSLLIVLSSIIFVFYLLKNLEINKENKLLFGVMSLFLFFISPFTTFFAISLHTEAIFTLFFILSLLFFSYCRKNQSFKNLILFGIFLGLAMQARITGIVLFIFFLLYLILSKKFKPRHLTSFIIALIIFFPYFILGGLQFLGTKGPLTNLALEDFTLMIVNRSYQALYFWWPFLILIFLGIFYILKTNNKFGKFHFWFIALLLIFNILTPYSFPRYWFILVPSLVIIICFGFKKLIQVLKGKVYLVLILFLGLFLLQGYTVLKAKALALPNLYYSNQYFLKSPPDCFEIKESLVVLRSEDASTFTKVSFPYFEQPPDMIFEYILSFIPEKNYNLLVINYVDDEYALAINEKKIINWGGNVWGAQLIEHEFSQDEQAFINILVINHLNIGGIGQILICQKNPFDIK